MATSPAWDAHRRAESPRKPAKFPFVNLLAAGAWAPDAPRSPADLRRTSPERQGVWYEWTVAQELFRRAAIRGDPEPERLPYWQSRDHEIDFVVDSDTFVEVKRGLAGPLDFAWFPRTLPKGRLTVLCASPFETDAILGTTLEAFLLADDPALPRRRRSVQPRD